MRFLKFVFLGGIVWLIAQYIFSTIEVKHPAGVLVEAEPQQHTISSNSWVFKDNYMIQPVARFKAKGRVLSTSYYRLDKKSKVAPYDIALGWKRMSDSFYVDRIQFSQSMRFYFYEWHEDIGITPQEVGLESSNIHIIPANDNVLKSVGRLRIGDVVVLSGALVNVSDDFGFYWNSSQNRADIGNGACEILWLESIEVMSRPVTM